MKFCSKHNKIPKIPILMYHEVLEISKRAKKQKDTNPAYFLSGDKFREQMKYIHDNGYKTLNLYELLGIGNNNHKKSVIITFDDGWENNLTNAFPILREFRLTATIFVITDFVGNPNYLSWDNLKEMNREGISIQSHTVSHRPLVGLTNSEIRNELVRSKKIIEEHIGTPVEFLSLPHGMINKGALDVACSLGYKAICTSEPGFSHRNSHPAVLKRINITESYDISTFGRILEGNQLSIFPAMFSKKSKNLSKKLLGYNNYRKLYDLRYRIRTH